MLGHILITGGLITGIFFIRALFGSHMQQRAKYALWLLVLAKLLLPGLSFEVPYGILQTVHEAFGDPGIQSQGTTSPSGLHGEGTNGVLPKMAGKGDIHGNAAIPQYPSVTVALGAHRPDGVLVLYFVWAVVGSLLAACLLSANIRFARRLHHSRRETMGGLCPLHIYESGAVSSPCLAGLLNPAIYLPPGFTQGGVCMGHVIAHEYMHYRHKDHIWAFLRCICVCAYWFHPLVWAAAFASAKDGELACDEAAIACLGERERQPYGRTLIQVAAYGGQRGFSLPYAPHTGSKNKEMKERVSMIVKKPKAAAATCAVLLCAVVALAGTAFSHTTVKEGGYKAEAVNQPKKSTPGKKAKKEAWGYRIETNADGYGGYFLDIKDCRKEGQSYRLNGASYADATVVFTDAEKKRLDNGETVTLSCEGAGQDYTLSKNTQDGIAGGFLLSDGHTDAGMELQKGQYGDREGWILSDPYSGMAWQPLLQADVSLPVPADVPVEVYNYYAYYEMFSSLFNVDLPGNKAGEQWPMRHYYKYYLKNLKKLAKRGDWMGDRLARVRVTGNGSSMYLTDFYLP